MMLIRKSVEADFAAMLTIVNDAAQAYRGVIPVDRWHEPYMPKDELRILADGRWMEGQRRASAHR